MGEYAIHDGQKVKIGTCEDMYYLRHEDRHAVQPLPGNVDPATDTGLRFRVPFPDEDNVSVGCYDKHNRAYPLPGFEPGELEDQPGIIQLTHKNGLLLNVPCYHGERLPDVLPPMQAFWNGKDSTNLAFSSVKNMPDGTLVPVIRCQWCGSAWRSTWEQVLPCVHDAELKRRLEVYAAEGELRKQLME